MTPKCASGMLIATRFTALYSAFRSVLLSCWILASHASGLGISRFRCALSTLQHFSLQRVTQLRYYTT